MLMLKMEWNLFLDFIFAFTKLLKSVIGNPKLDYIIDID